MYIVGAGAAYPETELADEFLHSLGLRLTEDDQAVLARIGVGSRRISLPLDYISATRNGDVLQGRANATVTPTALGAKAAQRALDRAGITIDQVGLLVADTATPYQTCPAEAHRIAGVLGVKIAAYDIVAGSGAIPLYIEMLSGWKPERVPDYVLCVSTNTPSQQLSFSDRALSAYVFGDAASAVVLSPRHPGKLRVIDSYLRKQSSYKPVVSVEHHISIASEHLLPQEEVLTLIEHGVKRLSERFGLASNESIFIGPQLFCGDLCACIERLGFSAERLVLESRDNGYALGASSGAAVASQWDKIERGQQVVVMHAGDGLWSGSLLLASE